MKFLLFCLTLFCSFVSFAKTESDIRPIGHYSGWRVYTATENGQKICFMAASPLHSSPKRENTYLMISRRPYEKEYNVITIMAGADYSDKFIPTFGVDNKKVFPMFTQQNTAFIKETENEKTLINQMIDGNIAQTVGKSKRGTVLKDSYSLKGFTKALDAIIETCP